MLLSPGLTVDMNKHIYAQHSERCENENEIFHEWKLEHPEIVRSLPLQRSPCTHC